MATMRPMKGAKVGRRVRRNSISWEAWCTERGKSVYIGVFPTQSEAVEVANDHQIKADRLKATYTQGAKTTVAEIMDDYVLPTLRRRKEADEIVAGTFYAYERNLETDRHGVRSYFGRTRIADVTPNAIREWTSLLLTLPRCSPNTVVKRRDALNLVLVFAVEEGWIAHNPLSTLNPPPGAFRRKTSTFNVAQYLGVRDQMPGDENRLLVDFLLETGARRGEAAGLRATDVYTDTSCVHLFQKARWLPEENRWIVDRPKGKKRRYAAVSPLLSKRLEAHLGHNGLAGEDLVFSNTRILGEFYSSRDHLLAAELALLRAEGCTCPGGSVSKLRGDGKVYTYSCGRISGWIQGSCRCTPCVKAHRAYQAGETYLFSGQRSREAKLATNWNDVLSTVDIKTDYLQYTWWMLKVWHPACAAVGPFLDAEGDEWKPTPHTLRHAHATWASEAGVPAQDIQDNHGHEQLQTTEIYLQRAKRIIRTTNEAVMAALSEAADVGTQVGPASTQALDPLQQVVTEMMKSMTPAQIAAMIAAGQTSAPPLPSLKVVK